MNESELIMSDENYNAFEVVWDEETNKTDAVFPLVEVGNQVMNVKRCTREPGFADQHKDERKNPKGLVLKMALEKPGCKWIWCDIPMHWSGLLSAVHAAAGLPMPSKASEIDPASFEGLSVSVEVGRYIGRSGENAKVARWLTAPVEKAVVKRTTDQKAKVAMSKDMAADIPF